MCRRTWPAEREVCGDCLASLVDDPDATVRCRHCGRDWPARMQSCPSCLAELRPDPAAATDAMAAVLVAGRRLPRPAGVPAFGDGPACTLARTTARSPLRYIGPTELLEATVLSPDHRVTPPLTCTDLDGTVLFRLTRYTAARAALVATGRDGAPLATFLRRPGIGTGLDVRDETSAPVARLVRPASASGGWELVETGGARLATVVVSDRELDERYVDDDWSLVPERPLPLPTLGAVALVLAAKALLGRIEPAPLRERPRLALADDDQENVT